MFIMKWGSILFFICGLFCVEGHSQDISRYAGPDKMSALTIEKDWDDHYFFLQSELKKVAEGKLNLPRLERETARESALYKVTDKTPADVVFRQTQALLDDLKRKHPAIDGLNWAASDLLDWRAESMNLSPTDQDKMLKSFRKLCRIRRRISFMNPLFDFDRILFLTHYTQRQGYGEIHMVDQFLGFNAKPGGELFILENPFSDQASAKPLFSEMTVQNGRLAGKKLENGSFTGLELSHDGKKIYFAWTEAQSGPIEKDSDWSQQKWTFEEVRRRPKMYHQYYWSPERCYHIFCADIEKGTLTQLTDGPHNDYDPCELPNGRIVFISERIGGNQRCGARWLASATLHVMNPDGSDLYPISYHETNEWQPSVTHSGMLAYTRWDYVDRDNGSGHHLWFCYPDGCDPRSMHANYPVRREDRPFMELGLRAVPNSHKYVGVACGHHGIAYGSLVLIDCHVPDDRMMSQVKRLTPEVLLPESETSPGFPSYNQKRMADHFATPWPLSEDFYLAAYARDQKKSGLYLVDAFGNRELLWMDDTIPSIDPIPFRTRSKPPVIPDMTLSSVSSRDSDMVVPNEGEVVVVNVYESEIPLPKDVKIKWLRVIHTYPKSNAYLDEPKVSGWVESLARGSLGLVPVEDDGSVYFKVPVGINVYFQLLDDKKQAVQSMRSSTFLHPGERLSCVGCHENKLTTPANAGMRNVKALSRAPSPYIPEPSGANPMTFPRLVQPVLNQKCLSCHEQNPKAPPLNDRIDEKNKKHRQIGYWTNSYKTLYPSAWGKHGGAGSHFWANGTTYSIPGKVGAKASKLLPMLEKGHHDVTLTADELYRLTLWMDLNSNFYGAYHDAERQAKGEIIWPLLGVPEHLQSSDSMQSNL